MYQSVRSGATLAVIVLSSFLGSSSCSNVAASPGLETFVRNAYTEASVATSLSLLYIAEPTITTPGASVITSSSTATVVEATTKTSTATQVFDQISTDLSAKFETEPTSPSSVRGPWTTMYSAIRTTVDMSAPTATVAGPNTIGIATIVNYCVYAAYLWPVDQDRNPQIPITIQPGQVYAEQYYFPRAGGVSLKLNTEDDINGNITQFEYTVDCQYGGFIWYDGSNVNCSPGSCPFDHDGIYLAGNLDSCASRTCAPDIGNCTGFYINPTDDVAAMMACPWSANVTMSLCYPNAGQQ